MQGKKNILNENECKFNKIFSINHILFFTNLWQPQPKNNIPNSESCGLAVEYSAQDWKIVGSIPVQCSQWDKVPNYVHYLFF